jgi:hypothetical protein
MIVAALSRHRISALNWCDPIKCLANDISIEKKANPGCPTTQEIIDNDFMVQLLHKIGSQPGCAFCLFPSAIAGCNGGKPLSHNNIARLKKRVTMRAFQAG